MSATDVLASHDQKLAVQHDGEVEGPLYPVDLDPTALREGMTLALRWADGAHKFGEYNLPVFGPHTPRA